MRTILTSAALLILSACMQAGADGELVTGGDGEDALPAPAGEGESAMSWEGYRAAGQEPFWNVTFASGQMSFDHFDAADAAAALPTPEATPDGYRFSAQVDGQPFIVEIAPAYCADSISGRPYPDTVAVTVHGSRFDGCGGDSASLVTGRPWQITAVGDTPVAGSVGMTVRFAGDGSISGYGGCNRYTGHYEIDGEGITTGPIAATRRACLDPASNQLESDFLAALGALRQFRIEGSGDLVLIAGSGTEIAARR